MKITLYMNGINIVLSYVMIVGVTTPFFVIPSLGMHGAGLALALSRAAGMVLAIIVILSAKSPIRLNKLSWYKPTKIIQKDILTLGVPTGVEQLLFQIGRMITMMMIVGMGTAAMAANVVGMNMMGFIMIPGNALTISIMVMVGQRVGRKDYDDISKITMFASWVSVAFMTVLSIILFPMGGLIARAFSLDAEAAYYFRQLYTSLIIFGPFIWPLAFVIPASLRAVKDVTFTTVISVITMWTFRIVVGYVLSLRFGIMGVWIGIYGDWASRSIIFWLRLYRKKWMNRLIKLEE